MAQLTLRMDDDLARHLKAKAEEEGRSVNSLATFALRVLVDPDLAGAEAERLRERLRRAGILADPGGPPQPRPAEEDLVRARAEAGKGKPLSDFVSEGRGG
jgi:predicted transcriptional regulator